MLSESLLHELNKQMNLEFTSSQLYLSMATYCEYENFGGFANFFLVQAEEERLHAMKIYRYINTLGKKAVIMAIEEPEAEFSSLLDAFEKGYQHEQMVTKRFYALSDIALNEREHATMHFLKWYIDEQIEEESMFDQVIQKLKRIENDKSALFILDSELATRKVTPLPPAK